MKPFSKIKCLCFLLFTFNISSYSQKERIAIPNFHEVYEVDTAVIYQDKIIYGSKTGSIYKNSLDPDSKIWFSGPSFVSIFKKEVEFKNCDFENDTKFNGAEFNDIFNLHNCVFKNDISFNNATFYKGLYISGTTFRKSPSFYNVQLPDVFMFSPGNLDSLDGVIDFSYCKLDTLKKYHKRGLFYIKDNKCRIVLSQESEKNTESLSKIFKKIILPSHLFTLEVFYGTGNEWDDSRHLYYEGLINQSKSLGMLDSAEGWEIEYEKFKNEKKYNFFTRVFTWDGQKYYVDWLPLGSLLNIISTSWWDFGHSKWKILLIWLPFFFLLFSTINYLKLDWMVNQVYNEGNYGKNFELKYENIKSRHDKIAFSLFYTAMIYFNFKIDPEAVNYKNLKGILYLYTIYALGTIHVTFGIISYIFE